MTEPPRPPGDSGYGGMPPDPTAPMPPPGSYQMPGEAPSPGYGPPPTSGAGGYPPPPTSGGGAYPPPTSGAGGYPPPSSGAGGYPPPGGGYPPPGTGGYPPPPGGGYPGGYPPPGGTVYGGGAPGGYANNDEKTWALVAHFGGAAGAFISGGVAGWIAPLIAMLAKGNESPTVRAHAVAALNFQILWSIIAVIGYVTMCLFIGFLITPIAWLVATILGIIAGAKAVNGEPYRYPMSVNMVK